MVFVVNPKAKENGSSSFLAGGGCGAFGGGRGKGEDYVKRSATVLIEDH
jgi:hypothetical protein